MYPVHAHDAERGQNMESESPKYRVTHNCELPNMDIGY